jgi:hypothetical protein
VKGFVAIALVVGLLFSGVEYAADYAEAFEGTPLAVLADGHDFDDGHAPSEHQAACDGCHAGGVHLTALLAPAVALLAAAQAAPAPWRSHDGAPVAIAPLYRPPIA